VTGSSCAIRRLWTILDSRLSWKLMFAHVAVALLTLTLVICAYAIRAIVLHRDDILLGQTVRYDPDFAQSTRLLAQLLPPHLPQETDSPNSLTLLLRDLGAGAVPGSGPLGGSLNEHTGIVILSVNGTVLSVAGVPELQVGDQLETLPLPEWREAFQAALAGSQDLAEGGPLIRPAADGTVLVSAYPIRDSTGMLLGAVGLRTQPLATAPSSGPAALLILVLGLGFVIGDFLVTAAIPAVLVSLPASLLLTRRMTRQLRELEAATDAIVRGEFGRRVAVLTRDELGHVAERFNLLAIALERLEGQRRAFFANVTHDLRTPLTLIRAHAEALLERAQPRDASMRDGLERILAETDTLSRLVDDLFTLARLEERGLPLFLQPISVEDILADVVETLRPLARRAGRIALSLDVEPGCPPLQGDPLRVRQIVLNLLHNALRHTPEGGVIRLTARREGAHVVVRITDSGCGVPAEILAHPFTRYQPSSDPARGSGLGLAVAKQLLEMQGGEIWIESQRGEGTTVSFRLPVATRDSSAALTIPGK